MENYETSISKLSKEINDDLSLSSEAKHNLNNIANILLSKLVQQSTELMHPKNFVNPKKKLPEKKTLSAAEIETATILIISPLKGLEDHSLNNGKKILTKVRNAKKGGTLAEKAGLILSVSKTANSIRSNLKKENLSVNASIYATAVLEYILAEILELSGNECRTDKKKTIKPNHIKKAVESDFELEDLMSALNISL